MLIALLLIAARLHAQDVRLPAHDQGRHAPAAETVEARVARARSHFVLGLQFFAAHAYRDAIREFELATLLTPSADIWFNIGRAHEQLGDYERARHAFERYLRDRVDAPDAAGVRQRLQALEQREAARARGLSLASGNGSLRIQAIVPAAVVALDGRVVAHEAQAEPIILGAGRHRLEVTREGFVPFRAEVSIEPGMLSVAHPRLQPLSHAPRPAAPVRYWTWLALGFAGAAMVGTGVLGGIALDKQAGGDGAQARQWARRSDLALAGTSVCALTAALLYFAEAPGTRQPSPAAAPTPR